MAKRSQGPTLARELEVRYTVHRSRICVDGKAITTAAAAAAVVVPILESSPVERFIVLHLDAKKRLLGIQEVGLGGIAASLVSIRAIFQACLGEKNSQAIILAHGHPSGDCTPSTDDCELTERVITAGRLFEVEVCDHLIVGHGCYLSFNETGRMQRL